jgi:hypothetical protein
MIHIQNIFDQKAGSRKCRDEEGDRPIRPPRLPTAMGLSGGGGTMSSHNDAGLGQYAHLLAANPHQTTQPPHRSSPVSDARLGDEPVPLGSLDARELDLLWLG